MPSRRQKPGEWPEVGGYGSTGLPGVSSKLAHSAFTTAVTKKVASRGQQHDDLPPKSSYAGLACASVS
jgi:hypothetical protein